MRGATVPEAPVDEDGDFQPRECHICHAARFRQDLVVDPVAQASSVKLSSQGDFGIGSFLSNLRHAAAGLWRRGLNTRHREVVVSPLPGHDRCDMPVDTVGDGTAEVDGNRIADEPAQCFEAHFAALRHEGVVAREALKDRSLSQ